MEKNVGIQLGKHIRHVGRLAQIANVLARHGFWSILESSGVRSWLTPEQVREAEVMGQNQTEGNERRLREALEELGPAFVKLGQLLASREDLIPESLLKELRKLHHDVAPLPFSQLKGVLSSELGGMLSEFKEISETPLAAGSIGQVHVATLNSGRKVVVKIQRPNIAELIRTDVSLMEFLAGILERYVPELKSVRPRMTIEEFTRAIEGELDFIREAGNTAKISDNFSEIDYVQLPEVYWSLSTNKVLTLSFVEGHSLIDKRKLEEAGLDLPLLVERGLKMFLKMVFVDGLYHGDLHAGNLLALEGASIGLLDCGLTVRLSRQTRENLAGLLLALVEEDYEELVSHFVELADPGPSFNLNAFEEAVANELTPFIGLRLKKVRVGRLLWRLAKIAAQYDAPLPRPLILFFKTLSSFEGIGSSLSPDFDILHACQEFSDDLVQNMYSKETLQRQALLVGRDLSNLMRHAPRQIRGLLRQIAQGDLQINVASKDILHTAYTLDRLVSRIAVSVILGSLVVGSSILVLAKVGQEYYHMSSFGLIGFAIAGILGLYVVWSIIRGGGKI